MDVDKSIHIQHSIISQRKRKHGLESHVGKWATIEKEENFHILETNSEVLCL
jgi:hypothetical protein